MKLKSFNVFLLTLFNGSLSGLICFSSSLTNALPVSICFFLSCFAFLKFNSFAFFF